MYLQNAIANRNANPPFLRGVFELERDNPYNTPNTTEMDDASFYASLASRSGRGNFDYLGRNNDTGTGNWAIRPGSFLEQLNQKYNNAATFDSRPGGGDSGGGTRYSLNLNYDALPKTKFGPLSVGITPYHDNMKVYNKNLVYDDPNYGPITLSQNVDPGVGKYIGPLLMAAVGMGMGSLVGAAGGASAASSFNTARSAIGGLQGLFNRNPGALLGMIPGLSGAAGLGELGKILSNPAISMGAKYFLANAIKNRKR